MSDDDATRTTSSATDSATDADRSTRNGGLEELNRNVDVIRGIVEQATRERGYREVSFIRLAAILAQILVAALLVMAASDVVFDPSLARPTPTIVKLLFAGVLQLIAMTAFLTVRRPADD